MSTVPDLRYALKMLRANMTFTVMAVLTLAIGIGGMSTIFSVVSGVLLRPLPYRQADRLVTMSEVRNVPPGVSYAPPDRGSDWLYRSGVFDESTFFSRASYTLLADAPAVVNAAGVPPNHLSVLGVAPEHGRDFVAEDTARSGSVVGIITYGFWQRRLGADPNVLGRTLRFAEGTVTVVGIMPRSFAVPWDASLEFLVAVPTDTPGTLSIGRLRSGVSPAQAEERIERFIAEIDKAYPDIDRSVQVRPLDVVDSSNRTLLLLLFSAVGFILMIATINLANLMMSRNLSRRHELCIRSAIGASRPRLLRQLLTESLVLAVGSGGLGLLAASFGVAAIVNQLPPAFPRMLEIRVDGPVVAFTVLVTLTTAIAFGLAGAFGSSRVDLNEVLKDGGQRASPSRRSQGFRNLLVTTEVALAAILLIGSALTAKSFWKTLHIPIGVDTARITAVSFRLPAGRYSSEVARRAFDQELLSRLRNELDVDQVALTNKLPALGGFFYARMTTEEGSTDSRVVPVEVTDGYFGVFNIPLVAGRFFQDDEQGLLINETLARRHWPNSSPIGRRLKIGSSTDAPWQTITGVVGDFSMSLGGPAQAQVFRRCMRCANIAIRMHGNAQNVSSFVRLHLAAIDGTTVITGIRTMDESLSTAGLVVSSRLRMWLFGAFALTGVLLAFVGVYGVTAYTAEQRRYEIEIRTMLGATAHVVVRQMLAQSLLPLVIGIGAGLLGAAALTKFLTSYLFEVSPLDPAMFVLVGVFLATVAFSANLLPIMRNVWRRS